MRLFFAGLLLLNVAFAGWYWFLYEPETVPVARADRGVEMLKLVTEQLEDEDSDEIVAQAQQQVAAPATQQPEAEPLVTAEPEPPAVVEPVPPVAVKETPAVVASADTQQQAVPAKVRKASRRQCYRLGLFKQKADAEYRIAEMQALGYTSRVVTQYPKKSKFVVFLPAYPSYAAASKVTAQLRASGQQDFQILAIKGRKNSISLGVYSSQRTAEIRRKEIAGLGYEPVVEPVYGQPSGFHIAFSKKDGSELTESEHDFLLISEKKLSIDTVKCGS